MPFPLLKRPATRLAFFWIAATLSCASGCRKDTVNFDRDEQLKHYEVWARMRETPAKNYDEDPSGNPAENVPAPFTISGATDSIQYWDLSLQDCVSQTLCNAKVLRTLQGRVLFSPSTEATIYDPAIAETNPVFGPEAALAAFDAQWNTSLLFNRSDRPLNSAFGGATPGFTNNENATFTTSVNKIGAAGTQVAIQNNTSYLSDKTGGTFFPSSYFTSVEANISQPLLQGAGLQINRIAGPSAQPGFFFANGVLLARNNVDISVLDFEQAVINMLSDLEDSYWDLNYAYRNLQAQIAARDAALQTWRRVRALYEVGRRGGEAENEAQARQQYLSFEAAVQNALAGSPTQPGVYTAERRLRRLMGLPPNDGRLIRPSDDPTSAQMAYDWQQMLQESQVARIELRRQHLQIRRRELELIAARNFLLPRLDAVAGYRFLGYGDDLMGAGSAGSAPFNSAFNNLFRGDFQEWDVGLRANVPLGFRRAWTNLRQTQLNITRERAVLREQQNQIAHGLSDAVAEMQRAFELSKTNYAQRQAATEQEEYVRRAYEVQRVTIDVLVSAQSARANAESAYYNSLRDYAKAIKNLQIAKGSLLAYNQVYLSEGPWPAQAYRDAAKIDRQFRVNYSLGKRVPWNNAKGASFMPPGTTEFPPSPLPISSDGSSEASAAAEGMSRPEPVDLPPSPQPSDDTKEGEREDASGGQVKVLTPPQIRQSQLPSVYGISHPINKPPFPAERKLLR